MSDSVEDWKILAFRGMGLTPYVAGLKGEALELKDGLARMKLPYGPHLVGDPDTGVVHGGVVTGMLDHTSGMAVMAALREPIAIATLDLRIDYMKPAAPDADLFFEARCLKVTHRIAFARGVAYQTGVDDPVAISTATFMLLHDKPFRAPEAA